MKRSPDLIRHILLEVEALPIGRSLENIQFDGCTDAEVGEHVRLLEESGYIDAAIAASFNEVGVKVVSSYSINRLLNEGHDFLAAARNETIWQAGIKKIRNTIGDVPLSVLKAVLSKMAMNELGL